VRASFPLRLPCSGDGRKGRKARRACLCHPASQSSKFARLRLVEIISVLGNGRARLVRSQTRPISAWPPLSLRRRSSCPVRSSSRGALVPSRGALLTFSLLALLASRRLARQALSRPKRVKVCNRSSSSPTISNDQNMLASLPHSFCMRIAAGIRIAASSPRRENCGDCRVYHGSSQITELNGSYKFYRH
jgi:hypothetical protein